MTSLTQVNCDDVELTDEELTELALAADADEPITPDAVPFRPTWSAYDGLLPDWYMPAAVTASHKRWHRGLVIAVLAAFLVINALGLCITYGQLVVA
jgi:hypothetical protein